MEDSKSASTCLTTQHLEVATRSLQAVRRNAHTLGDHRLSISARNLHIHGIRSEAGRVLEEVVRLPLRRLPRRATIGRYLELRDADVCVHNLHAEPELACAGLVLEHHGRGDAARHKVPANGDDALGGVRKLLEAVGVQVEVVDTAAGALIDDHSGDLCAAWAGHGYTLATGVGGVPVGVGESGAEKVGRDGVASEGAHAACGISAVEGGFATLGAGGSDGHSRVLIDLGCCRRVGGSLSFR
jgi:hypothetical protein